MIRLNLVNGSKEKKVLVDILPQYDANVYEFLERVIYICGIKNADAEDLQLYNEDFLLPYRLPSQCISPQNFYTVVFKRQMQCKSFNNQPTAKKDKKQIKKIKKQRKQKEQSSESEEEAESSSSLQDFPQVRRKNQQNKRNWGTPIHPMPQIKKKKSQSPLRKIQPAPKANNRKEAEVKKSTVVTKQRIRQISQSSEESQSQQKVIKPITPKPNPVSKIASQPPKGKLPQSSQSEWSSNQQELQQHKIYKQKVSQILESINSKTKQKQKIVKKPSIFQKPANIPIAVRNKKTEKKIVPVQNKRQEVVPANQKQDIQPKQPLSFKQYKEMKWVSVTKQVLNNWKQQNSGQILAQNNEIRFKVMELDEEKFVPVNSGWICGFITSVLVNGKDITVKLQNVTKESRNAGQAPEFFNDYEIPFHNMQELQINKITFTEVQKDILMTKPSENTTKSEKVQPPIKSQPNKLAQPKVQTSQTAKPAQSIQQFICGQIHYYFGQKNYSTDLFMQMHANRDQKKYIDCKLMLNFPKIKKVLTDEHKLWNYLITDDKYPSRNYELDLERRMIRKKGL